LVNSTQLARRRFEPGTVPTELRLNAYMRVMPGPKLLAEIQPDESVQS
jgi:hypothetical protein